ncbi:hypothetical protein J42TS3_51690 [Paenibacillus vini]|uniref:Uncharacterized protein n=1 Tax=Paenibacillus vini TaxID=1476024 RepID=A0ABQ4MJG6_9BACL|nr:hypothetical protein J42TS3_51690 [Paenibacillus vini]
MFRMIAEGGDYKSRILFGEREVFPGRGQIHGHAYQSNSSQFGCFFNKPMLDGLLVKVKMDMSVDKREAIIGAGPRCGVK